MFPLVQHIHAIVVAPPGVLLYTSMDQSPSNKPVVFQKVTDLVVLAVGLTLRIQNSGPVLRFEVRLSVHIDLDFNAGARLANRESGDAARFEKPSEDSSDSRWAPLSNNLTSLQGELGSKNGILDGSVRVDFAERKGLVHRRALVTESIDRSALIDSDTDG
jgi:hypothetical protein